MGTEEAESYLLRRAQGLSRAKASEGFSEHGRAEGYPKELERMFDAAVHSGKALLVGMGDQRLGGLQWIASVCGSGDRCLYRINCFALEHRVNGLCFCRRWLLKYSRNPFPGQHSHNSSSVAGGRQTIDSG